MVRSFATRPHDHRRGGVLLEFAIVALVFYVLFAAVIDMGRASFMASTANDAARVLARELARIPLPPDIRFQEAQYDYRVRGVLPNTNTRDPNNVGVYDERFLVIDLDEVEGSGQTLDQFFATLPVVNRALRPLMFYDRPLIDGNQRRLFRYPGALLKLGNNVPGYVVAIPVVETSDGGTQQVVRWLPVVQEVRATPPGTFHTAVQSPFHIDSPEGGIVAVRVNVPFQSSATLSKKIDPDQPLEEGPSTFVSAFGTVDATSGPGSVVAGGAEMIASLDESNQAGVYTGQYGLGKFYAIGTEIRPFRRILSGQAIQRREIFSAE